MEKIKNKLKLYRERVCNIENKLLEIEKLIINGANDDDDDEQIKELRLQIRKMELENKKIENILKLLSEKDCKIVSLIYLNGEGKKKVTKELDKTERQINYSINKALKSIAKLFID
ncbi:RNA polymerase subunit sigma-70 [Clostridium tagluense]|uniref:RNA polymerase sigma factor 70 region 4 type 2 domain-containing protein n=1 Tax=Clostridium tagluense TaxID=360422 RepID=A0A401UUP5_9CLOT|nr:RNA polymerase subunit sigma-70 [Clostridium tagluense]GCD13279.1 hypothetical protein Ctaglu_49020 [Clostridium tagluense]